MFYLKLITVSSEELIEILGECTGLFYGSYTNTNILHSEFGYYWEKRQQPGSTHIPGWFFSGGQQELAE